ncbi:hypothetical protein [Methylobacterium sp. SyP6R]|uniref:hypothetical protein n=1 Tax=Methylobacterium sp. SyP6R TaxID=2718876 RepID=UPI001F4434DF|nr:hypothetical protein [Methylobacterium sp. SyP6R]MCF4128136.1 hypothetical protein [Methylobacterium sp. SyP6R]
MKASLSPLRGDGRWSYRFPANYLFDDPSFATATRHEKAPPSISRRRGAIALEHFPTKWMPFRRRQCRKIKNLEIVAIAKRS